VSPERVTVTVEDRTLTLSNLDKVLYPATGFTKGEVIDYYTRIAPVMLPYLAARPLTLKRYPDGVAGKSFFEKNAPSHTPDWVRTVRLPTPGSTKDRETIDFAVAEELPTIVWAANLAALELHVPMWRVGPRGKVFNPDLLVFDLDPGPPASIVECCEVAQLLRERLQTDGLSAYPKTSGSKGMQLYVPLDATSPWEAAHGYAKRLARELAESHKDLVVWQMKKDLRGGKVLVDWSQNNSAKTTVAVYSLRARESPTASTPITWDEVEGCRTPEQLRFTAPEVLDRVTHLGDLFAPVRDGSGSIPAAKTGE
jgi:bifunctional non-homologous end joining protein LigD